MKTAVFSIIEQFRRISADTLPVARELLYYTFKNIMSKNGLRKTGTASLSSEKNIRHNFIISPALVLES